MSEQKIDPQSAVELFVKKNFGILYDWKEPTILKPIGPQNSGAFVEFSNFLNFLIDDARNYLNTSGSALMQIDDFMEYISAKEKWDEHYVPMIEKLQRDRPAIYAGGFGFIEDVDAYHRWATMVYWSHTEAYWLSVGVIPKPRRETEKVDERYPRQADFLLERFVAISRNWENQQKIKPVEFCKWAVAAKVDCPDLMFEAVGDQSGLKLPPKGRKNKTLRKAGIDERERLTFYKIILGLARKHYKYDETEMRSEVPKKIETTLQLEGLDVSAQTIRNHLKKAAEEVSRIVPDQD